MRGVLGIVLAACVVAATLARPPEHRDRGDGACRLELGRALPVLVAARRAATGADTQLAAVTIPAAVTFVAPAAAICELVAAPPRCRDQVRTRAVRARDPPARG